MKEFGTPQGIRAMVRCYVCLIIPLFFAPYWASISSQSDFAVAFFTSCALQMAMTGLLNVAITLEDPFDNVGLCGILVDEQIYEIDQAVQLLQLDTYQMMNSQDTDNEYSDDESMGNRQEEEGPASSAGAQQDNRVVRVATDNV